LTLYQRALGSHSLGSGMITNRYVLLLLCDLIIACHSGALVVLVYMCVVRVVRACLAYSACRVGLRYTCGCTVDRSCVRAYVRKRVHAYVHARACVVYACAYALPCAHACMALCALCPALTLSFSHSYSLSPTLLF
jgi:hypothetical protein